MARSKGKRKKTGVKKMGRPRKVKSTGLIRVGSEFKIEKGIPMPEAANGYGNKYPVKEMEVGDSFKIPYETERERKLVTTRLSSLRTKTQQAFPELKFSIRDIPNKSEVRMWRIE